MTAPEGMLTYELGVELGNYEDDGQGGTLDVRGSVGDRIPNVPGKATDQGVRRVSLASEASQVVRTPTNERHRAVDALAVPARTTTSACPSAAHPTLVASALSGLAGELVRAIDPHTEADEAAVLLTFLAGFGALVGSGPHALADAAEHPTRIWPLVVGDTAKARKGTSWAQVRRVLAVADPDFIRERVLAGFGSGEALVDAVTPPPTPDGVSVAHEPRLLVVEPEFAAVLAVCKREGSTLSTLLRQGWDGGRLQVRARARTAVADGAHIVVVGHITRHELLARLAESDAYGGLLNRFLIVAARRSKLLPAGGNLDDEMIADFGRKVASLAARARNVRLIRRTVAAEARWDEIYTELADDDPGGLLGAVIARDSAQMLRLSVTFALLDGAECIDVQHLEAALAVWRYCRASAALIFGELTGDPLADRILAELRSSGRAELSRTDLRDLFDRHASRERIEQAVSKLVSSGLAIEATEPTRGRPRVLLRLATKAT